MSSFCPYAFHHLMVEPTGEVRPCCRFEKQDGVAVDLQDLRQRMLNGDSVSGCRRCEIEESLDIPSMRQRAFNTAHLDTNSEVYLTSLEIAVGRVCNLKCRTCDSRYSTKWDADERALGRNRSIPTHDWVENTQIDFATFERVRAIKLSGGEPLLSASLPRLLGRLIELDLAKNIELQFFTNATLKPNRELIGLLESFGKIHLYLSIDGVGAVNEYLRHPSRWPVVEDVVDGWLKWQAQHSSVRCSLAHTLSTMNVLSFADFLFWRQSLTPRPDLMLQLVHGPQMMSLANVSTEIKKRLGLALAIQKENYFSKHATEPTVERAFAKIEAMLVRPSTSPIAAGDFFSEIGQVDVLRGENFAEIFPQVSQQLQDWTPHG